PVQIAGFCFGLAGLGGAANGTQHRFFSNTWTISKVANLTHLSMTWQAFTFRRHAPQQERTTAMAMRPGSNTISRPEPALYGGCSDSLGSGLRLRRRLQTRR